MNVDLTPELELHVQTKVDSGRYNSANEVVSEALLLMEQNDESLYSPSGTLQPHGHCSE